MVDFEGKIHRNLRYAIQDHSDFFDIHSLYTEDRYEGHRQRELTKKWIVPYADAIVASCSALREVVDKKIRDEYRKKEDRARYPEGACLHIVQGMMREMNKAMRGKTSPGMVALANFVREGGVMKHFWNQRHR